MAPRSVEPPLIVLVGPTASGKTGLAIELAKKFSGEIICADSRTVYKEMDVGTAKPTKEEQFAVPHWGIDLVYPNERFSAADFQAYATKRIKEIRARGHVPFLVGGSGLYIDSILYGYKFPRPLREDEQKKWANMPTEELYRYCVKNNIELPINDKNKRHLIRAITQNGAEPKRNTSILTNTIVVGIATEKAELRKRIEHRSEHMFASGVVEEATMLGKKYGWKNESMTGNVYKIAYAYLNGEYTAEEMVDINTT